MTMFLTLDFKAVTYTSLLLVIGTFPAIILSGLIHLKGTHLSECPLITPYLLNVKGYRCRFIIATKQRELHHKVHVFIECNLFNYSHLYDNMSRKIH